MSIVLPTKYYPEYSILPNIVYYPEYIVYY